MNCDQVFDILTRGPFPTGCQSDRSVEHHLAGCPDCRRLAEALRPALELFQEAVSIEESRDLPGYWGPEALMPPGATRSGLSQIAISPSLRHRHWRWQWKGADVWLAGRTSHRGLQMAAAMLFGFALCAALGLADQAASSGKVAANTRPQAGSTNNLLAAGSGAASGQPHREDAVRLAQFRLLGDLNLQPACLGRDRAPLAPEEPSAATVLAAGTKFESLQCCTQCHSAENPLPDRSAIAMVARSCSICHP